MRDVHEELRARLRESAEAHEPDRARILARIERGMAAPEERRSREATRPPLWGWVRVVTATAGVAGVLAVGGYAVASAVKGEEAPPADRGTVVVSPTPVGSPAATSRAPVHPDHPSPSTGGKAESEPGSTSSKSPSAKGTTTAPEPPTSGNEEDGPLWSDGSVDPHSNDFWAQSNLTLRTSGQLTELTVRLRIAQTGGVTSAGAWRSLPEQDFDLTVEADDGFLVYTWVLKDGRTVPKGEYVFAGQYNHERGGRDAGDDGYAMTAKAGGEDLAVAGDFEGHDDDNDSSDEGDS